MALWHKQGNLLLFDAGQAGRVLAESWAEFTTESLSRVLAEEKHRSHDAEWVRGGRRPDAVRQCTRAGSIFFLFYFQEGSLGIFFTTTLLGFFLLLMDLKLHLSHSVNLPSS